MARTPCQGQVLRTNSEKGATAVAFARNQSETAPGMSDATHRWRDRPGATDVAMLTDLAKELHPATTIARGYEEVLKEHRAGLGIFVQTERVPA